MFHSNIWKLFQQLLTALDISMKNENKEIAQLLAEKLGIKLYDYMWFILLFIGIA